MHVFTFELHERMSLYFMVFIKVFNSSLGNRFRQNLIKEITWRLSQQRQVIMRMMNCFCGMVDLRKAFSLISSRVHCQRSSPSRISDTPRAGFEPAQNLSSGLLEWSCAVVITTTPRRHYHCWKNFPFSCKWSSLFFIRTNFYKNKSLGLSKKFKNKRRTKPGLLSCRK